MEMNEKVEVNDVFRQNWLAGREGALRAVYAAKENVDRFTASIFGK